MADFARRNDPGRQEPLRRCGEEFRKIGIFLCEAGLARFLDFLKCLFRSHSLSPDRRGKAFLEQRPTVERLLALSFGGDVSEDVSGFVIMIGHQLTAALGRAGL